MSGGGNNTTNNITNALGKEQYQGIINKQNQNIGTTRYQSQKVQENNNAQTKTLQQNTNAQASKTRDTVKNQSDRTNNNLDAGFADTNANMDSGFADVGKDLDALGKTSNQTQNAVNQGFANQAAGFDEVNANIDTVGTNLASGFADVEGSLETGFNESANRDAVIQNTQTQGFTNLNDIIGTGFGEAANQMQNAQKSIMTGQDSLNDSIAANSAQMATFYGGLADGQSAIGEQVGGLQDNFSQFATGYDEDVTIANTARADLQAGMEGGFADTRAAIGDAGNAAQAGQQRLMQAVGGPSVTQTQQGNGTGFSAPPQAPTEGQSQGGGETGQLLTKAYEAANNPGIDPQMRKRFGILASSFNPDGQIIPSTSLEDGSTILRQLDNKGNLLFKTIAQNGNAIASGGLNVNDTFQSLKAISGGTNGFATPYSQTM